ncbi:ArgS-related anticodon-binding protein NrtL [Streptomyces sp. NPDC058417]|uniref:ArgS-related anticodon-binding protein NrtL n=1 Tax=unclassified Streptomyces TaxID=2593676 RepID=UPI0036602B74
MTPVELSRAVLYAVRCAVDAGELDVAVPARVRVAPPGAGGRGDYATNVALQLARPAGQSPLRVAEVIRPHLARVHGVRAVDITGPGFLNVSLGGGSDAELVRRVLREGPGYGHGDALAGQVLALTVPYEVRAEVVADVLARMVGAQGGRLDVTHAQPAGPRTAGAPVRRAPLHAAGPHDRPRAVTPRRAAAPRHLSTAPRNPLRPVPAPEDPAPLGPDAARWALLHPAPHDRPRISADHLVQRESNPLFRVRYAHARTHAVRRNAADLGVRPEPSAEADPGAAPLLALLADHPRLLLPVAPEPADPGRPAPASPLVPAAPSRLARHLVAVADAALPLLPGALPQGDGKPTAAHRSRLALAEAAGAVLAGGLSLLGIDAPEHL